MARARDKQQWNHTSALIATMFNARDFRTGPPARSEQFHPYMKRTAAAGRGVAVTKHTLKFLALAMGAEGVPD